MKQLARSASSAPRDQEQFDRVRELYGRYVGGLTEIGTSQAQVMQLREEQDKLLADWTKAYDAGVKLAAKAPTVEKALILADAAFKDARSAMWAYFVRGSDQRLQRARKSIDDAANMLPDGVVLASVRGLAEQIDTLLTTAPRYKEVMEKVLLLAEQQTQAMDQRTTPSREEMDKVLARLSEWASQRVANAEATAAAGDARANMIELGVGAIVVLMLIGSAMFGALSVGRPIRRIGEVLLELANGNKAVDVPYAERGDEVGDNARAAKTFKEKLIQIEALEAGQKEAEQRARHSARPTCQARRSVPGRGRRHRRHGFDRRDRAGSDRRHADQHRRGHPGAVRDRGIGLRGSLRKRPVGRHRNRGDDHVGDRDQPTGAGILAHRRRGGGAGEEDRYAHQRAVAGRRPHR